MTYNLTGLLHDEAALYGALMAEPDSGLKASLAERWRDVHAVLIDIRDELAVGVLAPCPCPGCGPCAGFNR